MRFQFTKIIEDRSPVVVTRALEKFLKREAWEIRRSEGQLVAVGIGTSLSTVNLSDTATFDIASHEGATAVAVDVEYQYIWFLSEDSQNEMVHSRIESVFANVRAALSLPPESSAPTFAAEPAPTPAASTSVQPPVSASPSAELPPQIYPDDAPTSPSPQPDVASDAVPSAATLSNQQFPERSAPLPTSAPRLSATAWIAAALLVLLCVVLGIVYFHAHRTTPIAESPFHPAQPALPHPASPPKGDIQPSPVTSSTSRVPSSTLAPPTTPRPVTSSDLRRYLEQWAAAERTRDAAAQASFYADDVRPYLSLDHASRSAILREKQEAIQHRQGLWTFKIERISIHRQSSTQASVLLRKVTLSQTNSVRVAEQRTSAFLTLKRTSDGWEITGERNLR